MASLSFVPIVRPEPIDPDSNLDEELGKRAEDAKLTLHFINMVIVKGTSLSNSDLFDSSDPFCGVTVGELTDYTSVIENDLNPVWNEKMQFFVAEKPKSMLIQVFDKDNHGKNDLLGKYIFKFSDMFEKQSEFEGDVKLKNGKKPAGTVTLRVSCRVLKPIETEIRLGHAEKQLACKIEEKVATEAILDESESLRKDALNLLTEKEQDVIKKAEELAEQQLKHSTELTEKEKELLSKSNVIESKIKEVEMAQIALQATELIKQEAETRLTEAEREILRKGEELEEKERLNSEALTEKEKAILEASQKLEEKDNANKEVQMNLEKANALKKEVENELTSKELIIMNQAQEIELKTRESSELLSAKDQEILMTGLALQEKDRIALEAQVNQDKTQAELKQVQEAQENLKSQTSNEISQLRAARKKDQVEIDALSNKCKNFERDNMSLQQDLEAARAEAANKKGCFGFC
uniref:C2 domain-containing protein n=1 Tax=Eucampia antarctica TaxID=49252 RepID=A0A7S2RRQ6_9STRA|mmetsp:Transcript_25418/g.24365  ORF Transcript_25418/g.24365 Transcript_25418/m.24365 type:complete len:466 (+) Transcript_25418:84-1481(+)|eukprot:CAMPEP_0197831630 /NCGR_PEP_ID=MMETSP1437-20131217/11383_1 /TAXON_ID=49252 ORGANISM="Eucampia antarctica, Strain CCMP1452" /NCGR_SAMPLE_ID=MMETSP1437 /ASSEMBLY_ACC=CAM_ASM_001096 /LENGTH=465 /DNA_ID=CAMNT_0043434641 /DNA_START=83 /DNA_END=1480 /DNA_ORIENTATION=+